MFDGCLTSTGPATTYHDDITPLTSEERNSLAERDGADQSSVTATPLAPSAEMLLAFWPGTPDLVGASVAFSAGSRHKRRKLEFAGSVRILALSHIVDSPVRRP